MEQTFAGVLVPVVTPFGSDLSPDPERFLALCKALLADGADGLAIFGTTSEANSIGAAERMALLDMLVDNGVPARKLMPGAGATAIDDVVRLMQHAGQRGCGGVLLLPPFYYKAVSDDGLFDFVSAVMGRTAGSPDVYLYHIPPVAQVGYSLDLVARLIAAFPDRIVGLKDSSGDWENTRQLLERFPGFRVFPGSEVFLLDALRAGGAGCITATGNVNVGGIRQVYANWQVGDADRLQKRATEIRRIIQSYPMVPALKTILADATGDIAWRTVRPPMRTLADTQREKLLAELAAAGFAISGNLAALRRQLAEAG